MKYTIRVGRFSMRDTQTVREIISSDPKIQRSVYLNLSPISYKLIISALQYTWISSQITIPSVSFLSNRLDPIQKYEYISSGRVKQ
jgi:hypothetical protein